MPELFKRAVRRIMVDRERSPGTPAQARPDRPSSFGWLRRPELDRRDREAWELPDGSIRRFAAQSEGCPLARTPHGT